MTKRGLSQDCKSWSIVNVIYYIDAEIKRKYWTSIIDLRKKNLRNLGIKRNELNLIRCICKKFLFNILPSIMPLWKTREKMKYLSLSTFIQQRSGGPRQCYKTKTINKRDNKTCYLQML